MIIPIEVYQELDVKAQEQLTQCEELDRKSLLLDLHKQVTELSKSVVRAKKDNGAFYNQYEELQELIALCIIMNKAIEEVDGEANNQQISDYQ